MATQITEKDYEIHCEKYEELGKNLQSSLSILLKESGISFLDVDYRIKEYQSFIDKVERKSYKNPFEDNEDFCGLRIICYFPTDIERIRKMINKEFIVHSSEDKSDKEIDRFGYRSYHLVVSIKHEWLSAPNFRGLDNLKVEIQVRTILMHAWAGIEHKLQYKKKEHIPKTIRRKFYQLSALFELADEQFENIRDKKEQIYQESLPAEQDEFDLSQEMNADTLQAFLDIYTGGDRYKDNKYTLELLDELIYFNISFEYLKNLITLYSEEELKEIEKDIFSSSAKNQWAQVGMIRFLLDMYNTDYFDSRPEWERQDYFNKKYKKEIN